MSYTAHHNNNNNNNNIRRTLRITIITMRKELLFEKMTIS